MCKKRLSGNHSPNQLILHSLIFKPHQRLAAQVNRYPEGFLVATVAGRLVQAQYKLSFYTLV
jgi:hypothetical protein